MSVKQAKKFEKTVKFGIFPVDRVLRLCYYNEVCSTARRGSGKPEKSFGCRIRRVNCEEVFRCTQLLKLAESSIR